MSQPARRRRIDAPAMKTLVTFLGHLGRTGSMAFAAERVGLSRTTLYRRKRTDPVFAAGWADAITRAVDRLHDEAVHRALVGNGRREYLRGRRLSAVREYDCGLLMRLLKMHWPAVYGHLWTGRGQFQK